MRLQILDLDGSLATQSSLADAAPWSSIRTIDLRDIGPRVRLWARATTIPIRVSNAKLPNAP